MYFVYDLHINNVSEIVDNGVSKVAISIHELLPREAANVLAVSSVSDANAHGVYAREVSVFKLRLRIFRNINYIPV